TTPRRILTVLTTKTPRHKEGGAVYTAILSVFFVSLCLRGSKLLCTCLPVVSSCRGGYLGAFRQSLVLNAVILLMATSLASAQSSVGNEDARFLAGLRDRRLYQLAETHCRQRLQATNLDDVQRAELTIELARALAAKALEMPPATSDSTWQQAAAATSDFA